MWSRCIVQINIISLINKSTILHGRDNVTWVKVGLYDV